MEDTNAVHLGLPRGLSKPTSVRILVHARVLEEELTMEMAINRMRVLDLISVRENSTKRVYRKYGR